MNERLNEMRQWVSDVLRTAAKGKILTDALIDKGFDLVQSEVSLFTPFGNVFISFADYNEIKDLYENQHRKIQAIKKLRMVNTMCLMDAKKAIEDVRNFTQPPEPPRNW